MVPVQTLSSVAQQRRELGALHTQERPAVLANMFSPTTSYFCFLKEGISYALCHCQRGKSSPFRAGQVKGIGWVGGNTWETQKELPHVMLFPSRSSGCALYSFTSCCTAGR